MLLPAAAPTDSSIVLRLPDLDRAEPIGEFWGHPETWTFAERLIDLECDALLDALEMGIWARVGELKGLVHHSGPGSQPVDPLPGAPAEACGVTSVGSRGDSYDNPMAESIIGLFETR
jgi:hypothetical protein